MTAAMLKHIEEHVKLIYHISALEALILAIPPATTVHGVTILMNALFTPTLILW